MILQNNIIKKKVSFNLSNTNIYARRNILILILTLAKPIETPSGQTIHYGDGN